MSVSHLQPGKVYNLQSSDPNMSGSQALQLLAHLHDGQTAHAAHLSNSKNNNLQSNLASIYLPANSLMLLLEAVLPVGSHNVSELLNITTKLGEVCELLSEKTCRFCNGPALRLVLQDFLEQKGYNQGVIVLAEQLRSDIAKQGISSFFEYTDAESCIISNKIYRRSQPKKWQGQEIFPEHIVLDTLTLPLNKNTNLKNYSSNTDVLVFYFSGREAQGVFLGVLAEQMWCVDSCVPMDIDTDSTAKGIPLQKQLLQQTFSELKELSSKVLDKNNELLKLFEQIEDLAIDDLTPLTALDSMNWSDFLKFRLLMALNSRMCDFTLILPSLSMFADSEVHKILNVLQSACLELNITVLISDQRELQITDVINLGTDNSIDVFTPTINRSSFIDTKLYEITINDGDRNHIQHFKLRKSNISSFDDTNYNFKDFAKLIKYNVGDGRPWRYIEQIDSSSLVRTSNSLGSELFITQEIAVIFASTQEAKLYDMDASSIEKIVLSVATKISTDIEISGVWLSKVSDYRLLELNKLFWQFPILGELLGFSCLAGFGNLRVSDSMSCVTSEKVLFVKLIKLLYNLCLKPVTKQRAGQTLVLYEDCFPYSDKQAISAIFEYLSNCGVTIVVSSSNADFTKSMLCLR